jgi:glycosyltransferase involved in cell wall biosynthesis
MSPKSRDILKILIVSQYYPPEPGGSSTRTYNIATGLALNGCDVTVITGFPNYPYGIIPKKYKGKLFEVEYYKKIRVIRTYMPPIKSKGFIRRLALIIHFSISAMFTIPCLGRIDAVWASSWIPGYMLSKIKRKPLILNVDDLTLEDMVDLGVLPKKSLAIRTAEPIFRLFYTKAAIITPISPGYFDTITQKYCVKKERVKLVRGGVDLSFFKTDKSESVANQKFTVLYSGGFSVAYDFYQIFDAAKLIESIDKDIEFIIQGSGELYENIDATIKKRQLKNVKIINSILSRTEVANLLSNADVLILPLFPFYKKTGRKYAGISSKLYEYQAAGKPIISCCNGIPSDYVRMTQSGIGIDSGDYKALADAVLKLKRNPQLAKTMGENGRKFVEQEASVKSVGLKMENILEEHLSQKRSATQVTCFNN